MLLKNVLDQAKSLVCGKHPYLWGKKFLLKTCLFVEILLIKKKIFCGSVLVCCSCLPWSWKTSLIVGKFLDQWKFPWLWKNSLIKKHFLDCEKIPWSRKISLTVEKFLDQDSFLDYGKISWLRKISLTVEKILDQRKFPWLWKNLLIKEISLTMKKFLDQRKFSWLQEKKIGLIILKTNVTIETIKTYILSLEQKLSSLTFFAIDKINIIFSRRLKQRY